MMSKKITPKYSPEVRGGLLSHEQALAELSPESQRRLVNMSWGWTYPTMSVILAEQGKVQTIIENPDWGEDAWEPFDPKILSDEILKSHRLDFSSYLSDLAEQEERSAESARPTKPDSAESTDTLAETPQN